MPQNYDNNPLQILFANSRGKSFQQGGYSIATDLSMILKDLSPARLIVPALRGQKKYG